MCLSLIDSVSVSQYRELIANRLPCFFQNNIGNVVLGNVTTTRTVVAGVRPTHVKGQ